MPLGAQKRTTHSKPVPTLHLYNYCPISLDINPLSPELNPICYLLALLAHNFLHVSRIRFKSLTLRLLTSYVYIWSTYSWCF
jgi:transposase